MVHFIQRQMALMMIGNCQINVFANSFMFSSKDDNYVS